MSTDASGATTSPDGIPTYNTSVDAPSGLGFNAAMAQIQAALSARTSKPLGMVTGETIVYNGTTFDRSSVTKLSVSSISPGSNGQVMTTVAGVSGWGVGITGPTITRALTPPGSPADGDVWYYVDSLTATTVQWAFRWNTGSSNTDKWEFIGGAPMVGFNNTASTGLASATYADVTNNVSFTVPRNGVYLLDYSAVFFRSGATTAFLTPKKGAAVSVDAEGFSNTQTSGFVGRKVALTLVAADVVKFQYKVSGGQSLSFEGLNASLIPARVS